MLKSYQSFLNSISDKKGAEILQKLRESVESSGASDKAEISAVLSYEHTKLFLEEYHNWLSGQLSASD